MKADFSGYATKVGLKCSDGLTIAEDAFKHQDKVRVPLVWMHGHDNPENVLGHAILENRKDGVYAYGFFNKTAKAEHVHGALEHGDFNSLSIFANNVMQRAGLVIHGVIREVSLVLAGANPGATIDAVTIRHSDGTEYETEDQFIIHTGDLVDIWDDADLVDDDDDDEQETIEHKDTNMPGANLGADATIQDVYDSLTDVQKDVVHFMIGAALEDATGNSVQQDALNEGNNTMGHNVFEDGSTANKGYTITHDDMKSIVASAVSGGSLKRAVDDFVFQHGITDIDMLFPDAQAVDAVPEWLKRRTAWVDTVLQAARKSPFSRIKTLSADITMDDARARGYITGNLKREEFFSVSKRVTTPQTIYKKQALDRDDMIDITDFDVVAWLKGEMRLMLDEELARAVLIGDGRDISSEDKINEGNIRPIAKDHELYTTTLNVNVTDANSSANEVIEAIIMNRSKYKGTGQPTMFTTETWIARFLLLKDTTGRRIYKNLDEVAADLRVSAIIPVEVMEEDPETIAVLVNMADYVLGADKGGEVNLFDDFDIDYNKMKYLIETRVSGALVKLKAAIVVKQVASTDVLVVPAAPSFVNETGVLTIVNQTGVVYTRLPSTVVNAAGSPYAGIAAGMSITVRATPAPGYYFASSDDDEWTFTRDA